MPAERRLVEVNAAKTWTARIPVPFKRAGERANLMIVHPSRLEASGHKQAGGHIGSPRFGRTWARENVPQVEGQSAGRAWYVNFHNGNCNHNDNDKYVRAVRS